MLDLTKLKALGSKLNEELSKLLEERDAAEGDEAKVAIATKIEAKKVEFAGVVKDIEEAKSAAKRREALTELDALSAKEASNLDLTAKEGAEAKDAGKELMAKNDIFGKWIRHEGLSGNESALIRPTHSAKAGDDAVTLPPLMTMNIMGKRWADQMGLTAKALASNVDTALIPQEYIPSVLQLPGEAAHILDFATVLPCKTGVLTFPRLVQSDAGGEYGGMSFTWTSEGGEKTDTEPEFEQVTITTYELSGYTEATNLMLTRSAITLEAYLTNLFREGVRHQLDNVFLTGSGTGQPLGVVNTTGIRTVARGTAGTVLYQDLVNLEGLLRAYHRSGARWIMNDGVRSALLGTVDGQNRPLFAASVAAGVLDRLLGFPWLTTERLQAIGTSGDIVFGDFSQYYVAMEQDIVVKRSEHYKFQNNKVAYTVCVIVGGRAVQPRAFAILEDASS